MRRILFIVLMAVVVGFMLHFVGGESSGPILAMGGIIGGPLRELKWGGITLMPTKDGEAEFEESGNDYEFEASPNGDSYSTAEAKIGYVQQECGLTAAQFKEFIAKKDGTKRAGTATMPNGDVLSLNCGIDGEHILSGGKVTVKLAGKVRVQ